MITGLTRKLWRRWGSCVLRRNRCWKADPDARYADILEREIYNGTISGMQLDGTKFFYINQLEANPGMPTNAYGEEEYTPERIAGMTVHAALRTWRV